MRTLDHYLSLNYPISIFKNDEGDYVAEVDDLSGCLAAGETPGEAFANAREAMRSWIESRLDAGLEVPVPRTEQEFSGKVLLRMPRSLHRRLSQQARAENSSLNQYMVSLLAERCAASQAVYAMPAWNTMVFNATPIAATQFFTNEGVFAGQFDICGRAHAQFSETCFPGIPVGSTKGKKPLPESIRNAMVA
jgi:antitoxin HicB